MSDYRKSKLGVYPLEWGWAYSVIAPDGTRVTAGGYADMAAARKAARFQARFYDRLECDRVDGVVPVRTDRVLERGIRACKGCGKPHDLVATTRRGRRSGQTWASPDCETYRAESWEEHHERISDLARTLMERWAAGDGVGMGLIEMEALVGLPPTPWRADVPAITTKEEGHDAS
jgi:hypothetical protein